MPRGSFYDIGDGGPLRVELQSVDGRDFTMLRPFAYRSADFAEPWVIPDDLATFSTDLASVPKIFTWLVPRAGIFTPAALLHDAHVGGHYRGPRIERIESDQIFREAMIVLGTGRVRAWMMWAAVVMATMWTSRRWGWRLPLVGVLATIGTLGTLSTLDLLGVTSLLPWLGQQHLWTDLLIGAGAAIVIPALLSLTWGRLWAAGAITGIAFAFLLHVTVLLAVLTALYLLAERLVSGPRAAREGRAPASPPAH
ncbi:DUF1353 domain-containing protein [Bogoriella caseilytica]|uniref:Uncharacterized protein DUF1353 n=1 Tax=Bogoriella caseilytica TaxID=56055 RepID=A0A3N2BBH3_9MICO|nr:DUF1353 domain-containing protein [Bogoriella caseilytica]ROR72522.1 uncharacterized protein DUF1353 [Bogoriella caseilytica]